MAEARQQVPDASHAERGRVQFVNGLWMRPTSWQPWIEEFDHSGYDCQAISWIDEPDPGSTAGIALTLPRTRFGQATGRLQQVCAPVQPPPVIIGHGLGGLVAEIALAAGLASAAISIAAPPSGPQFVRSCLRESRRLPEIVQLVGQRASGPPPFGPFARAVAGAAETDDARRIYETYVVPGRPMEAAKWLVRQRRPGRSRSDARDVLRGPLLLACGGRTGSSVRPMSAFTAGIGDISPTASPTWKSSPIATTPSRSTVVGSTSRSTASTG